MATGLEEGMMLCQPSLACLVASGFPWFCFWVLPGQASGFPPS